MRVAAVVICAALGLSAVEGRAQFPIGAGSVGAGGFEPRLRCNQPYDGRADFAVVLDRVVGGAPGFFCVSLAGANATELGLPVFVDVSLALPPVMFVADGPSGVAGAGSLTWPVSLVGLGPAAAGLSFYAQAAVFDATQPFSIAVSNGLEAQFTRKPQIFGAAATSGAFAQYAFIDGLTGALVYPSVAQGLASNLAGGFYADGGSKLYLANGTSIVLVDLDPASPAWSVFAPIAAFFPGDNRGVAYDRKRKILWAFAQAPTATDYELHAFDIDSASPTYGAILHQSTGLGAFLATAGPLGGPWSLRQDGKRLAVVTGDPKVLVVFDVEVGSPTFLQALTASVVPGLGGVFPTYLGAKYSRSGDEILVMRSQLIGGSDIARWSIPNGAWIDHDAAAPGVQNLGANSSPPLSIPASGADLAPLPNGDILVCGSGAGGFVGRVSFGTSPGAPWTYAQASIPVLAATRIAANQDGDRFAVGGLASAAAPGIYVFDSATLGLLGLSTLSSSGGPTTVKTVLWR